MATFSKTNERTFSSAFIAFRRPSWTAVLLDALSKAGGVFTTPRRRSRATLSSSTRCTYRDSSLCFSAKVVFMESSSSAGERKTFTECSQREGNADGRSWRNSEKQSLKHPQILLNFTRQTKNRFELFTLFFFHVRLSVCLHSCTCWSHNRTRSFAHVREKSSRCLFRQQASRKRFVRPARRRRKEMLLNCFRSSSKTASFKTFPDLSIAKSLELQITRSSQAKMLRMAIPPAVNVHRYQIDAL